MLLSAAKRLWTPEISRRHAGRDRKGIAKDFQCSIAAQMLLPDPCGIFGCYASRCCAIASPTMAKPERPEPSRKHFGPRCGSYVF